MSVLKLTAALTLLFATALCARAVPPPLQRAKDAKNTPALDIHGDPLPPGAVARLGTLRWRQKASGGPLVFSHDGKKLFSLDTPGNLYDWNAETGKIEGKITGQSTILNCLAYSPDGKYLAIAVGKRIQIWDLATGGEPRWLDGQGDWVWAIDFSRDSRSLISVAVDYHVEIMDGKLVHLENPVAERIFAWDVGTGKVIARLGNELKDLSSVAFLADGKHAAIANDRGKIRMLHLKSGKELWTSTAGVNQVIVNLRLSADGKTVWGTYLGPKRNSKSVTAQLDLSGWDVATGNPRPSPCSFQEGTSIIGMATVGNNVFAHTSEKLFVYHTDSGQLLHELASPGAAFHHFAVSANGKHLAANGWTSRVLLWDLKSGKRLFDDKLPDAMTCRFLPDNKTVLSLDDEHSIHLWNSLQGKHSKSVSLKDSNTRGLMPRYFDLSPDGKSLAMQGRIWDIANGDVRGNLGKPILGNVKFSPDGKSLAAFYTSIQYPIGGGTKGGSGIGGGGKVFEKQPPDPNYVGLFDSTTGQRLHQIHFTKDRSGPLVFSEDGKKLLVADTKTLLIWDIAAAKELLKLEGKQGQPHCFTPNAAAFVEFNGPTGYVLKSSTTGKVLRKLALHPTEQFEAIAPNSKTAIFRLPDAQASAISLRDLTSGKKLALLDGKYGNVTNAAFSPDGAQIVVGYSDSTALVWDIKATLRSQPAPAALKAQELDQLWKDLGSADEAVAITALDRLAAAPEQALPLMKKHVSPLPKVDFDRLLADLDSDSFAKRDKASHELAKQEFAAAKAMRAALNGTPTLETRQRLLLLLKKLDEPITAPELLASWRAVNVLEQLATPNAQKMLETLANGAPEARLTEEALAALNRLQNENH
ncbi:MAG TPA: WD40 repeat domain-containing protein [Gemmataceae bacterium]|nr:WD40 repeat domain-containing protein [Gemmataceae bacterium]